MLVVPIAGHRADRERPVDPRQVLGGQLQVERAQRLGQPAPGPGPDERYHIFTLREDPGNGELRRGRPLLLGDCAQGVNQLRVRGEVVSLEAWEVSPTIPRGS